MSFHDIRRISSDRSPAKPPNKIAARSHPGISCSSSFLICYGERTFLPTAALGQSNAAEGSRSKCPIRTAHRKNIRTYRNTIARVVSDPGSPANHPSSADGVASQRRGNRETNAAQVAFTLFRCESLFPF